MKWRIPNDSTDPLITAEKHIESSHVGGRVSREPLPETCVIFEIGMALRFIESHFRTRTLLKKLPCFLDNPKCICVKGIPNVCFTRGGYGAPAAVDTLETVRALGVKRVIVAGMCGGFSEDISVGDVLIPSRALCEEGTSFHYFEQPEFAVPDKALFNHAVAHYAESFPVRTSAVVTCDAVYRQTFAKEARWRESGCAGVDMETSALLSVSQYYSMPAVSVLLCSDKHPVSENAGDWTWGENSFKELRENFVRQTVKFASQF